MTGNKVQLLPDNPAYEPIVAENVAILGKLIALFRKY
jgi:SOS-response transcriptional repressor LexA